jgi:hypothetical protein
MAGRWNVKPWFDWRAAVILLALPLMSMLIRNSSALSPRAQHMIRHELGLARSAGWPAELVVTEGNEADLQALGRKMWDEAMGKTSFLLVSETEVVFLPSQAFLALPKSINSERHERWLMEARLLKDTEGTASALVWSFLTSLKEARKLPASLPLATLPPLVVPSAAESPSVSADWGLPLAILVPYSLWLLRRRARAKASAPSQEESELAESRTGGVAGSQEEV